MHCLESTLTNCCDHIVHLDNLLSSLADTSILSRVTRALANLSQNVNIAYKIVKLGVLPKLMTILKESTDAQLLQSTLRTIRVMSISYICINVLEEGDGIPTLIELLRREHSNDVKRCCLQTLLELIEVANGSLATKVQEHGGIDVVCQLSYWNDKDIAEICIKILCVLTNNSFVRVSVGTSGGIEAFMHQIKLRGPLLLKSVEGVCLCCREAVGRNKIRTNGGVELLLGVLCCSEYSKVFENILGAFACFSYDDVSLKRMISGGLIPLLISLLKKVIFAESKNPDEPHKQECKETASSTTLQRNNFTSESRYLKPTVSARSMVTTTNSYQPLPLYPGYPASPPSSMSPHLSPELRVPFMSTQYSPDSSRSSSPMVYSPCASEVEDNASSDSDNQDTVEDDLPPPKNPQDPAAYKANESQLPPDIVMSIDHTVNDKMAAVENSKDLSTQTPDASKTPASRDVLVSSLAGGSSRSVSSTVGQLSTSTSENVITSWMEDLPTTCSGIMPSSYEEMCGIFCGTNNQQDLQWLRNEVASLPHFAQRKRVSFPARDRYNEYLRLFLPGENPFSADQPYSSNRRRSSGEDFAKTTKKHSTSSTAARKSDSLPELKDKILFLLSRFEQMPDASDSEGLLSPECLQVLLDYLSYSQNPDPRCLRLLNRLAWNVKFFEKLIIIMFPGAVYRQLVCGLHPSYLLAEHCSSSSKLKKSPVEPPEISTIVTCKRHQFSTSPDVSKSAACHANFHSKASSVESSGTMTLSKGMFDVDNDRVMVQNSVKENVTVTQSLPENNVVSLASTNDDLIALDLSKDRSTTKALTENDTVAPDPAENKTKAQDSAKGSTVAQDSVQDETTRLHSDEDGTVTIDSTEDLITPNSCKGGTTALGPSKDGTITSFSTEKIMITLGKDAKIALEEDSVQRKRTKDNGETLLSVLATQANCSFSDGTLAHLLLRGTQKQKEACALSLPYVCKYVKHIFTSYRKTWLTFMCPAPVHNL